MPDVTYIEADGTEHSISIPAGLSVMEGALNEGLPGIDADCGGACACATCHVKIAADWLERVGPPNEAEAEMLEFAVDVTPASRLSCQITLSAVLDGLVVHLPETQR
jgi:ferredoxin, 2Fe-2S